MLKVEELTIEYVEGKRRLRALDEVSIHLTEGETLGVVGESGSGKSTLALAIMGLLTDPRKHGSSGRVLLNGVNLLQLPERKLQKIRGGELALIFQDAMTAMNPVKTIGWQIDEALVLHRSSFTRKERYRRALDLLDRVGIPRPDRVYRSYPHELSGGMRQRALIAMSIANDPRVLVADEPTTALDVIVQAQVLSLLRELQESTGCGLILISHDLGVVAQLSDRVVTMYGGRVVEESAKDSFFKSPKHPYSEGLLQCVPHVARSGYRLEPIPGTPPSLEALPSGCSFHPRCGYAQDRCREQVPVWEPIADDVHVRCFFPLSTVKERPVSVVLDPGGTITVAPKTGQPRLEVADLQKSYLARGRGGLGGADRVIAVDSVSFRLMSGQTLGIVGESGSGKTTVARCLTRLVQADSGRAYLDDDDILNASGRQLLKLRSRIQMVFQDPASSLDPRKSIADSIAEPLLVQKWTRTDASKRVAELLDLVGLSQSFSTRNPRELSGGQKQRVGIARALAVSPSVIVLDEPTAALDVSIQAQVLELLKRLQEELGLSYLLISHDLGVVRQIADHVMVMSKGRVVEAATNDQLFMEPKAEYTKELLAAVPSIPYR